MSTQTIPPTPRPQGQPRHADTDASESPTDTLPPVQPAPPVAAGSSKFPPLTEHRPSKFSFWGWIVLSIAAVAAWYFSPHWLPRVQQLGKPAVTGPAGPMGPRTTTVNASPVIQQDLNLYLNGLGTVTAFNTVTIRSRVEGQVNKVAFTEGQMVNAGDLLIEIDSRQFEMQRDQAKAQLQRDEATLKLAEATLGRQRDLMRSQASTPQLIDEQVAQVEQAKAAILSDRASLHNAELQIDYSRITSPITGRIGLRLVDQGNIIQANSAAGLAVITQVEPITLTFTIPQDEIPRVQKQMQTQSTLSVEAFDRDFRTKLSEGVLSAFDNQVDPTTGTLRLKATFENKDHILFPNQFVNARMLVETIPNALLVPNAALQRGPGRTFVFVVLEDNTVEIRQVTLGPTEGGFTSITEGVKAGELVVTNGLDKLENGSKVMIPGRQGKGDVTSQTSPQASPQAAAQHAPAGAVRQQPESATDSRPTDSAEKESQPAPQKGGDA